MGKTNEKKNQNEKRSSTRNAKTTLGYGRHKMKNSMVHCSWKFCVSKSFHIVNSNLILKVQYDNKGSSLLRQVWG